MSRLVRAPGADREMTERSWLDLSGFVYMSLGEGACRQQLPPPSSTSLPCARRAGSPGTAIVRFTNARLSASLPLPLVVSLSDPTGVAGWGAGWGPGCLGLRVSSSILFPMTLSTPLWLHQCAHPHCPVFHPHSSSKHLLSAFVYSVLSFCVMCLALALVFQLAAFSLASFILSLESHKGTEPG